MTQYLGLSEVVAAERLGRLSIRYEFIRIETPWIKEGAWRVIKQEEAGGVLLLTLSLFAALGGDGIEQRE